ncbi:MAG: DNA/RNA non-specific endonuclease [Parachlamydiaceae bacterium]|nr:DNA/RNA non-specific endonuclease [Parachlamydiaceae bacterium]
MNVPSISSSFPTPHFNRNATKRDLNQAFINVIQDMFELDPFLSEDPDTCMNFYLQAEQFLSQGGSPILLIPEISVMNHTYTNITFYEVVYLLSRESYLESQEDEYFGLTINLCIQKINELIEDPSLNLENIKTLLKCVISCDPYLESEKTTGNLFLNLVNKFLIKQGNPTDFLYDVLLGDKRFEKLAIIELVYLLWKRPYVGEWEENEFFQKSFQGIIAQFHQVINENPNRFLSDDERLLPLIKCLIEYNINIECEEMGNQNIDGKIYTLKFLEYFVTIQANPNLSFQKIKIGKNSFSNPTVFHVAYLYWKDHETEWNELQEERFQKLIENMLKDPRTNLSAQFSEHKLGIHHFVNRNIQSPKIQIRPSAPVFYRTSNSPTTPSLPPIIHNSLKFLNKPDHWIINQLEGHSLEKMTIAHYAIILKDYDMLFRFLTKEPRLLEMKCCMTKGKGSLGREKFILIKNNQRVSYDRLAQDEGLSGDLIPFNGYPAYPYVTHIARSTDVTLLHLAARVGSRAVFTTLRDRGANQAARDSYQKTPQDYLALSISEGIIVKNRSKMLKSLNPTTKYIPGLPEVSQLFHYKGYDLCYDPSRKIAHYAHERLCRGHPFGQVERKDYWKVNEDIPLLNRSTDKDFVNLRFLHLDKGHMACAENSSNSIQAIDDTFQFPNAAPQNDSLNRGVWRSIESRVRELVKTNDVVQVFTGPLFVAQNNQMIHGTLGQGNVHVPTHFFKIIYIHNRSSTKEVYICPNQKTTGIPFTNFQYVADMAIDYIQANSALLLNKWDVKC